MLASLCMHEISISVGFRSLPSFLDNILARKDFMFSYIFLLRCSSVKLDLQEPACIGMTSPIRPATLKIFPHAHQKHIKDYGSLTAALHVICISFSMN